MALSPVASFSQDAEIVVEKTQTVSIKKMLRLIHQQSNYKFVYNNNLIQGASVVTLNAGTTKASQLLESTLNPLGLTYKFTDDGTILIKRVVKPIENTTVNQADKEIQYQITGTVSDENGQPLPGASILEKGTTNGVQTNFDGEFVLELESGSATLVVSYLGFSTKEVQVTNKSSYDVVLTEDASALSEVVVVGYGTQERRKVTGAIETVQGDAIVETPVLTADNALAGRVPGLVVNQANAEPGRDNARLLIRGIGTTGNNDPLIVIDGVANRGGFSRIDPNDIESISVLKDASAAIYGAQAANGVILVTTKRGKDGKAVINYSHNRAFVSPTREIELADAALYAQSVNTLASQQGQPDIYSPEQIQAFANGSAPSTDWINEVYKSFSDQQRQSLSVRGGNEKSKYFASLGTAQQDGLFKGNDDVGFKQYNVRANLDAEVAKNLNLRLDLAGRNEKRSFLQFQDATIYGNTVRAAPDIPATIDGLPARGREGQNPLAIAQGPGYLRDNGYVFNSRINLDYAVPFLEGLKIGGWMAADYSTNQERHFFQPFTYYQESDNGVEPVQGGPSFANNFLRVRDTDGLSLTYNANIDYNRTFGDHTVGAFLAYEQNKTTTDITEVQRNGFETAQIDQLFAGSGDAELQRSTGFATELTRQNYFGRVSYDFASKYLLKFVFRYDGSSIFPEGNRFGFFPGVEGAWRISQENFFKDNINFINELKFRGSYGELGNDRVDPFQYLNLFQLFSGRREGYVFGGQDVNIIAPSVVANPNITWETLETTNLGFDLGMLKNSLTFSVDVFKQLRDNILGPRNVSVPNYTGLDLPDENIRKVENKGYELQGRYNKLLGDFSFYVGANYSYSKSNVLFVDEEGIYPEDYQKAEGHVVGSTLAYDYLGFYKTEADLATYPGLNGNARIGDPYYRDVNEDGVVNSDDRIRIDSNPVPNGSFGVVPQVQYGFQIGGAYKGIELNTSFAGQAKALQYLRYSFSNGNNGYRYFLENAFDPVRNPNGTLPSYNRGNSTSELSTLWLRDVSFLRLRSIELAYSLPQEVISSLGLSNLRFSLSGFNLITWDNLKDDGLSDPESLSIEGWQYPYTKNINFGVNLTF
ncbi:TonB-dependent receptor [Maribacter sp. LLG6340-A2]|uniref:TonB-dependent receptor n=1 Tax=Maribacter sp. LLG6340-A2 TaxID=3160834 RepID=UPI003864292C